MKGWLSLLPLLYWFRLNKLGIECDISCNTEKGRGIAIVENIFQQGIVPVRSFNEDLGFPFSLDFLLYLFDLPNPFRLLNR